MEKKLKEISVDLTRRCNLACKYCSRGEAQNRDITREIIDKTLDELCTFDYIRCFQFMGGEPFLCPELLKYCVDGIIKRHLNIDFCAVFSNGTVKSEIVLKALARLHNYLREYAKEHGHNDVTRLQVIFSVPMHDNAHCLHDVMNYYADGLGKECINSQEGYAGFEDFQYIRDIEGNGEKNYREMLSKSSIPLGSVRRIHNKYHFVNDDSVSKTISVSTNGTVYVGASLSYDRIDHEEWICNIQDCNNDLFERVNGFCWRYPISDKAHSVKERCLTVKWCHEHGVDLKDIDKQQYTNYCILGMLIDVQERYARDLHKEHPELLFVEVEFISSIRTMQFIKKNRLGDDMFNAFADNATYFADWKPIIDELDSKNPYLFEWGKAYIEFVLRRANERIRQGVNTFAQ